MIDANDMKTVEIDWDDEDNRSSWILLQEEYDVNVELKNWKGDVQVLKVSGTRGKVKRFMEDFDSGDMRPFAAKRDLSDEEYIAWLNGKVQDTLADVAKDDSK